VVNEQPVNDITSQIVRKGAKRPAAESGSADASSNGAEGKAQTEPEKSAEQASDEVESKKAKVDGE